MPPQEGAPGARLPLTCGGGRYSVPLEHVADRGAPERVAQLAEFALEAPVAPPRVLPRQPQEHVLDLDRDSWSATAAWATDGPPAADQVAVPSEDGLRLEEQDGVLQAGSRASGQARQLGGEDLEGQLLPAGEAGLGALALQETHLALQQEDLYGLPTS